MSDEAYAHGWRARSLIRSIIRMNGQELDYLVWKFGEEKGPWVYVVSAVGSGRIKIGFTTGTLLERMKGFETGCPFPTKSLAMMRGSRELERDLHQAFAKQRKHLEWFEDSEPIRTLLAELTLKLGGHTDPEMTKLVDPGKSERDLATFLRDSRKRTVPGNVR